MREVIPVNEINQAYRWVMGIKIKRLSRAVAVAMGVVSISAMAQEPTAAEQVAANEQAAQASAAQTYAVTIAILEELIQSGLISLERAQELLTHAEQQYAQELEKAARQAESTETVRVPYISEATEQAIRDELREEVAAQAREERWGVPDTLPGWLSRISWSGDFRGRYHMDRFDESNFPYFPDVQAINDAGGVNHVTDGLPFINSTEERDRLRYRARLTMSAEVNDKVRVVMGLASGNDNGPTSTNESMADYFAKDDIYLNLAYADVALNDSLDLSVGRMPNPFFSTDLVWDADINLEGVALSAQSVLGGAGRKVFVTGGVFPLYESALHEDRMLYAGQIGIHFPFSEHMDFQVGASYYRFNNVQSKRNPPAGSRLNDHSRPGLLAQGNSVFNMRTDGQTTLAGLASEFELLNLTAETTLRVGDDKAIRFTADYVRNVAMDEDHIERVRGEPGTKPGDTGWHLKFGFGHMKPVLRRQWQMAIGYKRLETDAVMDVFTDSDFGVYGGTDLKGYTVEAAYNLADQTSVGFKWLSADSINRAPFSTEVFLLDLNTKF